MNRPEHTYRDIARGTAIFGGVQVFQMLVGVLRGKFIAVLLGPAGMGVSALLTATMAVINQLSGLGLNLGAMRDISMAHAEGDTRRLSTVARVFRRLVLATGVLGALVAVAGAGLWSRVAFGTTEWRWAFVILGGMSLLTALSTGETALLQGTRRLTALARSSLVGAVAGLVAGVPMYWLWGTAGIAPAMVVLAGATWLAGRWFTRRLPLEKVTVPPPETRRLARGMIALGVTLTATSVLTTLSNMLIGWFVRHTGGVDDVGLWQSATTITTGYIGFVFSAMAMDYFPRLAAVSEDPAAVRRSVNRQGEMVILIAAPIIVALLATAPLVVRLLLSAEFAAAVPVVRWMGLALLFKTASFALGYISFAKGDRRTFFWLEGIVGNVLVAGCAVAGYALWGIDGLGIATLVTYAIYLVVVAAVAYRRYDFRFEGEFLRLLGVLTVLCTAAFVATLAIPHPAWRAVGAGAILVATCAVCARELDKRMKIFNYTARDIERYCARIGHTARRAFERGDTVRALARLDTLAQVAWNVNHVYTDPDAEQLMEEISASLSAGSGSPHYTVGEGRWLFYDQIGNDTVLALQYLRALMSWGVEILYVLDSPVPPRGGVIDELSGYPGATVMVLDTNLARRVERFGETLGEIRRWGPARAMIHAPAGGAFGVALLHALSDTVKYRIVPGDHHFYLGTRVTDRALEFRPFGATVALERRGMTRRRILVQPYYPITKQAPFEGFRFDPAGRTVIFSGGSYYKILGGDERYFRIVRRIVDENPATVVQYSGWGSARNRRKVTRLVEKYRLAEAFFLDGFRGDVGEVMRRCDIYLGTCPLCGGLMSQYAALNARPVLQLKLPGEEVNAIEDIIGLRDPSVRITFDGIDSLVAHAARLIASPALRRSVGAGLRRAVITPEDFASQLRRTIENDTTWDGPTVSIDYDGATEWYLELVNDFSEVIENTLVRNYGVAAVWMFPKAAAKFTAGAPHMLRMMIRNLTKR